MVTYHIDLNIVLNREIIDRGNFRINKKHWNHGTRQQQKTLTAMQCHYLNNTLLIM